MIPLVPYPYENPNRWGIRDNPNFEGESAMPINVDHPEVLKLFDEYRAPIRWDSAAFLICEQVQQIRTGV